MARKRTKKSSEKVTTSTDKKFLPKRPVKPKVEKVNPVEAEIIEIATKLDKINDEHKFTKLALYTMWSRCTHLFQIIVLGYGSSIKSFAKAQVDNDMGENCIAKLKKLFDYELYEYDNGKPKHKANAEKKEAGKKKRRRK